MLARISFMDLMLIRFTPDKMTLPLGEQGHNIPSVDFASGPDGDASHVLATDINGNLWIFNLSTREKQCKPRIHTSLDRENVM